MKVKICQVVTKSERQIYVESSHKKTTQTQISVQMGMVCISCHNWFRYCSKINQKWESNHKRQPSPKSTIISLGVYPFNTLLTGISFINGHPQVVYHNCEHFYQYLVHQFRSSCAYEKYGQTDRQCDSYILKNSLFEGGIIKVIKKQCKFTEQCNLTVFRACRQTYQIMQWQVLQYPPHPRVKHLVYIAATSHYVYKSTLLQQRVLKYLIITVKFE